MSDRIYSSDKPSDECRVIYVASGWPEHEISQEDALRSESYIARHFVGDRLDHIVWVRDGIVSVVIYHGRAWPNPELLRVHQTNYGATPFDVFAPLDDRNGVYVRKVFELDATGSLVGQAEHVLDIEGNLLSETRMRADGEILERFEYVYDEAGELILTRAFGPDGELYDEFPSEPN